MPAGTKYLIPEGMLSKKVFNVDRDKDGVADHYCFTIRNQFLHAAHPLAWYQELRVCVDGAAVDPENIAFVLRGQWFHAPYMSTVKEVFWLLSETAEIYVRCPGGLQLGVHNIQVTLVTSNFTDTWFLDTIGAWGSREHVLTENMEAENR